MWHIVHQQATIGGAKALLWDQEIGSIEKGKKADLIIIDVDKPHLTPINDLVTTLVYSANAGDVSTVIIDGKILLENKQFTNSQVTEVLQKAREKTSEIMEKILSR